MAVSNTVANLSGFLAPLSTGHLLDVENSLQQWQLAFWVPNSILFFYLKLNLVYHSFWIFGRFQHSCTYRAFYYLPALEQMNNSLGAFD